jgi:carbonic anhydrase
MMSGCSRRNNVLAALLVALFFLPAGLAAQWKTHWDYAGPAGPSHWGDLDPAYATCKTGRQQSPIDIEGGGVAATLPRLRFEFHPGPVRLINNGYTAVRVNYPRGNDDILAVGGTHYELVQFHFHHPSEEQLDGRPAPLGLHLMFQAPDGRVAGVAVFLRIGHANPVVKQLWKRMPATPGPERLIHGLEINPDGLLPTDTSYYTYAGSQTAPPCTEGVTWYVLRTPMFVSGAQVAAFAQFYPHDVRPVQPLNGRQVRASR